MPSEQSGYIGVLLLLLIVIAFMMSGVFSKIKTSSINDNQTYLLVTLAPQQQKKTLQLSTLAFITPEPTYVPAYPASNTINACKGYAVVGSSECDVLFAYRVENNDLKLFYADESQMPLGVETPGHSVSKMANKAQTAHVSNPLVGDTSKVDANKYPYFPAIFLTDITTNPNSTAGYAQNGGIAIPPHEVYGRWQADNVNGGGTVNWSSSGNLGNYSSVTANPNGLGPGADLWPTSSNGPVCRGRHELINGAEVIWHIANLKLNGQPLQSQHTYLIQFTMHDGDNYSNDVGDGCTTISIP